MVNYLKTKAEFDAALSSNAGKLVVIDYTATWCPPCRMIGPKFEAMATEFPDVVFYKVDVDENNETAEDQGISAMPTFNFYRGGKKVDTITGANENALREKIKELK